MSTSKTVFPGVDSNFDVQTSESHYAYNNNYDGNNGRCGTFFPGMNIGANPNLDNSINDAKLPDTARTIRRKPLVGFLYSVSRGEMGEYWPLYIGQNSIGTSPNCDICLKEATVSQDHALFVIRKMKNPEKVIASISDTRSTNGTMINGVSLGFSAEECKNGDIITFGENYQCLLILIDAKEQGLCVSESFIPLEIENNEPDNMPKFYANNRHDSNPNQSTNATIGVDDNGPVYNSGGTVGM
ncbi:MAG: FHA domain-containing protein [Alistipes sp.]|nr:FHA domain-containing protein [Alistipes sp.]